MYRMLARLLRRADRRSVRDALRLPDLHLRDLHLPDLHLRDLRWKDVRTFAAGKEEPPRDGRTGIIAPTMLTLAGAGAAIWWWRQWARGRAESESVVGPEIVSGATAGQLDGDLAVLGGPREAAALNVDPAQKSPDRP